MLIVNMPLTLTQKQVGFIASYYIPKDIIFKLFKEHIVSKTYAYKQKIMFRKLLYDVTQK